VRHAVSALAVVTALGLAACGDELDAGSIEKDAREGFQAAGVTVDDVSCPSEGAEGETIECTVTVEGGDEVKLPYKVGAENVEATEETIQVINDYAAGQGGGGGGGGGAEEETTTTPGE
jgi:hypothetical protein